MLLPVLVVDFSLLLDYKYLYVILHSGHPSLPVLLVYSEYFVFCVNTPYTVSSTIHVRYVHVHVHDGGETQSTCTIVQ